MVTNWTHGDDRVMVIVSVFLVPDWPLPSTIKLLIYPSRFTSELANNQLGSF